MRRRRLILISGKDPLARVGGHHSYVQAHALAAASAGFEPHVFCMAGRAETTQVAFGVLHRVRGPLGIKPPEALQGPLLARAVVRFLTDEPGSQPTYEPGPQPEDQPGPRPTDESLPYLPNQPRRHLIHGFGIWAGAGVMARNALARRGIAASALASAYATREYEMSLCRAGLQPYYRRAHRIRYRMWARWSQLADDAVEGWGYRRSQLLLVNYESVRRFLQSAYRTLPEIRRIPYASAAAFHDPPDPPEPRPPRPVAGLSDPDAPLVLAVSRHTPRKGVDLLLRSLADLTARGVAFRACLVGPGQQIDAHRRLAAELGLSSRVAITGRVADVRPYLRSADVFVLPSLGEASGSVSVLEALQASIPVIACCCDGIPEDLADGTDALLVEPGDVQALGGALRALLTDPALRARLAANGRRAFERKFSAERFVTALGSVYSELAFPDTNGARTARSASATYAMSSSDRPGPEGR